LAVAKVYVTRPIAEEAIAAIRGRAEVTMWPDPDVPPPHDVIVREVSGAAGLLCLLTDPIDAEVVAAGDELRVISTYAVGYDNIDVAAATARGIPVCNTPGVLTETTADLAWALIMAASRRIAEADAYLRAEKWKSWSPQLMLGHDVYGATLGIVGFGRIGQAVARRARGFHMRVLYTDIARKPDAEEALGAEFADLRHLLRTSDFVSLHTPLTEETHHLIGAEELALMKPTAVLVNTARGPLIDGRALAEALSEGRIFAAGLDVFESEPIAPDDPLLSPANVVLLPHIGSASVATRTRMAVMAAENLLAALAGERPRHLVNPEVLES
jgi:glyoxylate reductase